MARSKPRRRSEPSGDLRALADEDLMQLVRRGQAAAFEVIYDRHVGAAYSLAYRMCGNRSAAEDVTQEAFLSIWRSAARYDRMRGSVRTWVLGIVHNRAIDGLRRSVIREAARVPDEALAERPGGARADRGRGRPT
jgi:RNA polymerase sigma-70 factor, ECF subfamily